MAFFFTQKQKAKRGFSLVELSIVMSVVGTIIGGVWVVSSLIIDNIKQERLTEQMGVIVSNIRGTYTGRGTIESTVVPTEMPILTGRNVFSGDAVRANSGVSVVDSPFGANTNPNAPASVYDSLYVCGWRALGSTSCDFSGGATDVPLFAVEALLPAGKACINAVLRNFNAQLLPGVVAVYVNGNKMTLPITVPAAKTACVSPSSSYKVAVVDFVFRITP